MFARFLIVGGLGFMVDFGLTQSLIWAGIHPVFSRPPAVIVAMLFTWVAHRRFTFRVPGKRSFSEAVRFVTVAGLAFCVNVGLYTWLVVSDWAPGWSIVASTLAQIVFSFAGYRFFAFSDKRRILPPKTA